MCVGTYTPKISEDLIPVLFRMGLKENSAMTRVVDEILRDELHIRGLINAEQAQKYKDKKRNYRG
jgi:hypothetical protein